jgi:NADH:ubiquinone oxidoreductase subunit D
VRLHAPRLREARRGADLPQVNALVNRIDWLGHFANEVPFILAAEKLMDVEAPPRAQ